MQNDEDDGEWETLPTKKKRDRNRPNKGRGSGKNGTGAGGGKKRDAPRGFGRDWVAPAPAAAPAATSAATSVATELELERDTILSSIVSAALDGADDPQIAALAACAGAIAAASAGLLNASDPDTVDGSEEAGYGGSGVEVDPTDSVEAFRAATVGPMASLLADYGEQEKLPPRTWRPSEAGGAVEAGGADGRSLLARRGSAPIHVDFVSFGYRHGRLSGDDDHLVPPVDVRRLPPVPAHLEPSTGKNSGAVKRYVLTKESRNMCQDIARDAALELVDAIKRGAGYASPRSFTVSIGSEEGRHRSVVMTEDVAVRLRRLLRREEGSENFTGGEILKDIEGILISVGTSHRDVEKARGDDKKNRGEVKWSRRDWVEGKAAA